MSISFSFLLYSSATALGVSYDINNREMTVFVLDFSRQRIFVVSFAFLEMTDRKNMFQFLGA